MKRNNILINFTDPNKLYSYTEVLSRPSIVPNRFGIYAWYFRKFPPKVIADDCIMQNGLSLLYVGISPSRSGSKQNLRKRIRNHCRGNASTSTLRLTLGCLLSDQLGIQLQRTGKSGRMTFTKPGEEILSAWMEQNAFVYWQEHPKPWEIEEQIIGSFSLPLNLRDNEHHPFYPVLTSIRKLARAKAKKLSAL
jgi:GIY-YIG catalytic domain